MRPELVGVGISSRGRRKKKRSVAENSTTDGCRSRARPSGGAARCPYAPCSPAAAPQNGASGELHVVGTTCTSDYNLSPAVCRRHFCPLLQGLLSPSSSRCVARSTRLAPPSCSLACPRAPHSPFYAGKQAPERCKTEGKKGREAFLFSSLLSRFFFFFRSPAPRLFCRNRLRATLPASLASLPPLLSLAVAWPCASDHGGNRRGCGCEQWQ